ncbi:SGNH/GDSL hydrolase family protein [Listeria rustica]|uniref:SGNH/GDSL hydrolase family protein n=1 Tax=Listeria rustica TaxID=2713503 RepID=A0A7W1T4D9_9LIST|nr:SGNH/GDSL hydrolase family protein [Listeria rustica]MBA3925250.1 SGNH/GDSL hydrolase family protein [Listeria rustica]
MKKLVLIMALLLTLTVGTGKVNAAEVTDWSNTTWNVLGDSLTDPNNTTATKRYFDYIQETMKIKKVNNYGKGGSTVSNLSLPMSERYISMDDSANLITVFGGLNDYGRNVELGTLNDTANNTYYGGLDTLLKGLVKKYPNKKIGFISMYSRTFFPSVNRIGIPDYAYVNAEIDVCDRYNIKHLNLYEIDSLNLGSSEGRQYSTPDGVHLNTQGHQHLAEIMEPFIKSL